MLHLCLYLYQFREAEEEVKDNCHKILIYMVYVSYCIQLRLLVKDETPAEPQSLVLIKLCLLLLAVSLY